MKINNKSLLFCLPLILPSFIFSNNNLNTSEQRKSKNTEENIILTFNVTTIEVLPSECYLAMGTSLATWNPLAKGYKCKRIDSYNYSLVLTLPTSDLNTSFEYKWTKQITGSEGNGWLYPEIRTSGSGFGNRSCTVTGTATINDQVTFTESQAQEDTVTQGTLKIVDMVMDTFEDKRERKIRIWLPNDYDPENKKYPVLYMHDGQNLFDDITSFVGEWKVDESMDALGKEGIAQSIVVGIDNGGDKRFNELSPNFERSSIGSSLITAPCLDKYADFIVKTVKPYIDENYATYPDKEHTGIGGSSMGGVASLYMALKYKNVFDYGLIFSAALHLYTSESFDEFINSISYTPDMPLLYLMAGNAIGVAPEHSAYDETLMAPYPEIIKNKLIDKGYNKTFLTTIVDDECSHTESSWVKYFPLGYKWLIENETTKVIDYGMPLYLKILIPLICVTGAGLVGLGIFLFIKNKKKSQIVKAK